QPDTLERPVDKQTLERTTAEHLAEEDPDVGAGPAWKLADHVVAVAPVERRCLIAVGVQMHLVAAAAHRLRFGRGQQPRAQTAAARPSPGPSPARRSSR